ncbi:MAG: hypothetical protein M1824_004006 [Vezdaea acicularis]|nr:MAG: hypothetical protein M1824_004006 [Vezdaea acicularis]
MSEAVRPAFTGDDADHSNSHCEERPSRIPAGIRPSSRGASIVDSLESARDPRRHSVPALNFLLPQHWSRNASIASLVESEQPAIARLSRVDASIADQSDAALRSLDGISRRRTRHVRSIVTGSPGFVQPVVVRTYQQATRARSQSRQRVAPRYESNNMDPSRLPSITDFTFESIMRTIEPEVSGTIDAIADICANSRYSLANQYEVHIPPHSRMEGTVRAMEHSLVPVSEATSEGDSASPTHSRKGGDTELIDVETQKALDEAAKERLTTSTLSVGEGLRSSEKVKLNGGLGSVSALTSHQECGDEQFQSIPSAKVAATGRPAGPRTWHEGDHSPPLVESALGSSDPNEVDTSHSCHLTDRISLRPFARMSGLESYLAPTQNTIRSSGSPSVLENLIAQPAPQVMTEIQTAVVSGSGSTIYDAASSRHDLEVSGAMQAVSIVHKENARRASLFTSISSWFLAPNSEGRHGENRATLQSAELGAEGTLRTLLKCRAEV